jgi:hypothetical protein
MKDHSSSTLLSSNSRGINVARTDRIAPRSFEMVPSATKFGQRSSMTHLAPGKSLIQFRFDVRSDVDPVHD